MSAPAPAVTVAAAAAGSAEEQHAATLGACPSSEAQSPTATIMAIRTETAAQECAAAVALAAEMAAASPANPPDLLWYFAIGSMMNPTSMCLRNLHPKCSKPGILHGWSLVFRGAGGMGDIDEDPAGSFHGILHLLTAAEFKHLDTIEGLYLRTPVSVVDYAGNTIQAFAYKMDHSRMDPSQPNNLPGERYLDIIMRGARHYGVDPAYIEKLAKVPVIPRKTVAEYRSVPTPPLVLISEKELAAAVGADPWSPDCTPLMISVNGKVLRWVTPLTTPQLHMSYSWSRSRYAGVDVTLAVSKVLYEPLYPVPTTYEAMPEDMRRWAEELFVGFTRSTPEGTRLGAWESVGWLQGHPHVPKELLELQQAQQQALQK